MNIFEAEEGGLVDLRQCKIKYLCSENNWMHAQLLCLNSLIHKYKKVIQIQSDKQNHNQNQAIAKLKLLNASISSFIKQTPHISTAQEIVHDEMEINPLFFAQLILTFQQRIDQFRVATVQTENSLQKIEQSKNIVHFYGEHAGKPESSVTANSIQSYDIYAKVQERYKKKILDLKIQKNHLQLKLKNIGMDSKKDVESMSSTIQSQDTKKSTGSASELDLQFPHMRRKQQLGIFEQSVSVYKKTKYTNSKLKQKIRALKKTIENKKAVTGKLQSINENQVWNSISLCQNQEGEFFFESNINSISVMNPSDENMEFDVDLSRILNLKKLKTFQLYKAERMSAPVQQFDSS